MRYLIAAFLLLWGTAAAESRDPSQWSKDVTIQKWFQNLRQPDHPDMSCCGAADSFEADDYDTEGDHYVAIITDGYGTWPTGTRVPVANTKIKWDEGNPTGHGILFLQPGTLNVYCYTPPSSG